MPEFTDAELASAERCARCGLVVPYCYPVEGGTFCHPPKTRPTLFDKEA